MHVAEELAPERRRGVMSLLASGLRQGFLDAYTGDSLKAFLLFHIRVFTLLMFLSLAIVILASAGAALLQAAFSAREVGGQAGMFDDLVPGSPVATAEAAADSAVAAAAAADAAADAAARSAGEEGAGRSYRIIEPAPPFDPDKAWEREPEIAP